MRTSRLFVSLCCSCALVVCAISQIEDKEDIQDDALTDELLHEWLLSEEKDHEHSSHLVMDYNKGDLWPGGVVHYELDPEYDDLQTYFIETAMRTFENVTALGGKSCIRFVKKADEEDYLYISPIRNSCFSKVGKKGGKQVTSLSEPCLEAEGKILHELMHVLGFLHEQSRNDRDDYIKIVWDNILTEHYRNFEKYSNVEADHMGLPYDYNSVLHYSEYAFSKDGEKTILPLEDTGAVVMGQREKLSEIDIKKIRLLYEC